MLQSGSRKFRRQYQNTRFLRNQFWFFKRTQSCIPLQAPACPLSVPSHLPHTRIYPGGLIADKEEVCTPPPPLMSDYLPFGVVGSNQNLLETLFTITFGNSAKPFALLMNDLCNSALVTPLLISINPYMDSLNPARVQRSDKISILHEAGFCKASQGVSCNEMRKCTSHRPHSMSFAKGKTPNCT